VKSVETYSWWPEGAVIRIDDISTRTDEHRLTGFLQKVKAKQPNFRILLAVSLGVIETNEISNTERVFPPILNAMSDHRNYFQLSSIGIPNWLNEIVDRFDCEIGSHGLFHVDHRLLGKEAQTISIMSSLSLLKTRIFVPPFNKYNQETIEICRELDYKLVVWEDGWKHLGYQKFGYGNQKFYMHMHDFNNEKLESILQ
jgi:hypothetical protein